MNQTPLIPGHATQPGTVAYARLYAPADTAEGHFSEFPHERLRLSSLGVGTFGGAPDPLGDAAIAAVVARALTRGVNVIDTAAHYRYGRSLAAVGAGVRTALAAGVPREALFLISKGGFLTWRGGPPRDRDAWFAAEIEAQGLGTRALLAKGGHLLTPEYLNYQLELSRHLMGVATLDAFLVDQPEVHIPECGKEETHRRLEAVFVMLERAVAEGRIRCYGISTFEALRVETDAPLFQSMTALVGLAQRAASTVTGDAGAGHHFRVVSMPFNQVMPEGFTRFNTATGQGNVASPVQAAHQLKVYMLASHALLKGHLAGQSVAVVAERFGDLPNPAQRALQFCRSTPGIGTTLVGISSPGHLEDVLAVACRPVMPRQAYLGMYQRADV